MKAEECPMSSIRSARKAFGDTRAIPWGDEGWEAEEIRAVCKVDEYELGIDDDGRYFRRWEQAPRTSNDPGWREFETGGGNLADDACGALIDLHVNLWAEAGEWAPKGYK